MADNQTGEIGSPEEITPPSGAIGDTGGSPASGVEAQGSRQEGSEDSRRKGGPSPYQAQMRVQKRLEERLERMEQSIGTLAQNLNATKSPAPSSNGKNVDETDFWSNPKESLAQILEEREKRLIDSFNRSLSIRDVQSARQQNLLVADQYLAKLGEFDDEDLAEMKEIAKDPTVSSLAAQNPERAAKLVYMEWMESKGGSPKTSGIPKPSKIQATGVQGNAPGVGPKVWSAEEIAKIKGTPAYSKYKEQIRNSINARAPAAMRR